MLAGPQVAPVVPTPLEAAALAIVEALGIDPSLRGQVEAGLSAFQLEGFSLEAAARRWSEVFLDARSNPPERDDAGRRVLPPVVYERVEHGWALPAREKAIVAELTRQRENGLGIYAPKGSAADASSDDPFACPNCGGPAPTGWTYCSRLCRLTHRVKRRHAPG